MPITGLNDIFRNLDELSESVHKSLITAVYLEALEVQKLSMELTPVLTGALKGSHVTELPVIENNEVAVTLKVGGPAAPYAMYVHENLDARHDNGQAKFLESAILAYKDDFVPNVAARLHAEGLF